MAEDEDEVEEGNGEGKRKVKSRRGKGTGGSFPFVAVITQHAAWWDTVHQIKLSNWPRFARPWQYPDILIHLFRRSLMIELRVSMRDCDGDGNVLGLRLEPGGSIQTVDIYEYPRMSIVRHRVLYCALMFIIIDMLAMYSFH